LRSRLGRRLKGPGGFLFLALAIEFLDEFVFGAREAAWQRIRDDLGLCYLQVGLLLSVPLYVGNFIEPAIFLLSDVWQRKVLIVGGGLFFALSCVLAALSNSFWPLLFTFIIFSPASGAFVTLTQAALMDREPERRENNMARWAFAGSLGVVAGTAAIGALAALGAGWRPVFWAGAGLAVALVFRALRSQDWPDEKDGGQETGKRALAGLWPAMLDTVKSLRRWSVARWLVLLEFADLMLDVLLGFLALYLVDAGKATPAQAALGVAVWSVCGLAGDFLLIPVLERMKGLSFLRVSVLFQAGLFAAFLLAPALWAKLALVGALGLTNAGLYAILQAQPYASMPGRSGSAVAMNNVAGLAGSLLPLGVGAAASAWGIGSAMWLLLAGPVALIIGLPRRGREPDAG
jgi:FSR family fosmidomycin resistance protein-like MFS transporter